MKSKYLGFWKEIGYKSFMLKLRYWIFLSDLKNNWLWHRHCKKGFHDMKTERQEYTIKNRTYKTVFHKCRACQIRYFLTKKDKVNYNFMENRMTELVGIMAKDILKRKNKKMSKKK